MAEKPTQNKYDFAAREPYWQDFWQKEDLYKFDKNHKGEIFSVDTPPPYVSAAHLHVGHAMSYTQAEFVIRYKRMRGFNVFYPMGFDDNGLPTERFVETKYKVDKSKISKKEFVDLCLKETKEGSETYRKFWNNLGISVDWSLSYSTINEHCQRIAQRSFIDLYKKGFIERKEEPVIWCPHCQTALSQSDLDDQEQKTHLNYIEFKFDDGSPALIATTRPELLPACVALYVNKNDERYQKYIGKKATVPLFDYEVPVMADEHVDIEFGTGLMMVCTFGDTEDIDRWKNDKLETRSAVTVDGRLNDLAGKYKGMKLPEAREAIVADLEKSGDLKKREEIENVCNVHERCGTISEFIITPQWFIKIADNKDIWRKRGEELKWFPKFMKAKYDAWVDGLKWDWCISRQRFYGVPFPVWYCEDCGEIVMPEDTDLPVDPTEKSLDLKCRCGGGKLKPETDVMDTWMTSSLTPLINAYWQYPEDKNLMNLIYPMSLRIQAFEIIRTWLFDTVVKSHYHTDSLPWNEVMISGWGLDEKGKKISKREGNFIDPDKIISEFSADALRYWSAGATLGQNLRYNPEEVKVGKRTVTKLYNASRFVFMNMESFDKDGSVKLEPADKWIMSRLQNTLSDYTKSFDGYEYSHAKDSIDSFFWNDFCDNYLEFVKYRLYGEDKASADAAKSTLYTVLLAILKMYAPLMPFITEEIYQEHFKNFEDEKSIHITQIPDSDQALINKDLEKEFSCVLEVIAACRKHRSEKSLSFKNQIEKITVKSEKEEIKKYDMFIQSVANVEEIIFVESDKFEIEII